MPGGLNGIVDEPGIRPTGLRVVARREGDVRFGDGLDGVEGAVEARRRHARATRALVPRLLGECTDHGDACVGPKRQQRAVVLQQDHALGGRSAGEGVMARSVNACGGVAAATLEHHLDHSRHSPVERRLIEFARLYRGHDPPIIDAAAGRHLEVQPGLDAAHTIVGGTPVRNHGALETPLVPEYAVEQPVVLATVGSVQPVVGAHHHPRVGFPDGDLEAAQVDLPQRPFVDDRIDHHAPRLLVVGCEVLDAGTDALRLGSFDHRGGQFTREQRILREVLEIPATPRVALDIDPRAEDYGDIVGETLDPECDADFVQQVRIPRAGQRGGRREAGCGNASRDAGKVSRTRLFAQAVRTIREHDRRQSEALVRGQVPEVRP